MYISQVRLNNIRGFHGKRSVDLSLKRPDGRHAGWTVIAGRNGSGKTTLLRGIALAVSGPAVARNLVPDFDNWISLDSTAGFADVQLTWDSDAESFSSGRRPAGPFWAGLSWATPEPDDRQRRGNQPVLDAHQPVKNQARLPHRGPWQDNPAGWFCAAYGPFRRLVGGAGDAQRLMLSPGPVARLVSLFHEDASLAEGVGWLIEQHLRSLEGRPGADTLKNVALEILSDGLLPDSYQIERVDSDGLWIRTDSGHEFPLREMSDGYRTIAALVVDLIKQIFDSYGHLNRRRVDGSTVLTSPGVVIIDEIDAHLHVSWQKRIGEWLKTHFPQIQFIVTTHSPYICQAADESGLIRLPGPDDEDQPRVVDEELYERVVFGSGDDAVLSELFGLDTPYSVQATRLRRELVEVEGLVLAGQADRETVLRYRQLRARLTSSPSARTDEVAAQLTSLEKAIG